MIKVIECPRDAMQGLHEFIPTELKIKYINQLLPVGFDTIDVGSFVSPKAIPQMKDSAEVLAGLDDLGSNKLSVIIANERGIREAVQFEEVTYLGFPLSLSETFQQRNTNRSIADAFDVIKLSQEYCQKHQKTLNVYLSMGFGNPYGDPYSVQYVTDFSGQLAELGVSIISLSDTIGVAAPENISPLFKELVGAFPDVEFGAHLHSTVETVESKLEAVINAGCQRIDGAIRGFGGCPMAKDDLVGNMPTEKIIEFLDQLELSPVNQDAFGKALLASNEVFLT